MDRIRIASFPHYSYLPQYVAEALHAFTDEGLRAEFQTVTQSWSQLLDLAADQSADIVLGNVWFSLQTTLHPGLLIPIANCARQCRFVLTSRDNSQFDWDDLIGKVVLVPSEVPTPWVAFRAALKRKGLVLDSVRVLVGFTYRDAIHDFMNGLGDYLLLDLDRAQDDRLFEAAALADVLGPVPWSLFFARRTDVQVQAQLYRRFQRAIARAQAWIADSNSITIADTIAEWFGDVDRRRSVQTIERYKSLQVWALDPTIVADDVARWQVVLLDSGLQSAPQPVDPMLAFANSYRAR